MVFVYGNAFSKEDSAFSLVREIRKREPRVCLLSALSDDEAGLSVIDTMISETILFDPATVYPGTTADNPHVMSASEIKEILEKMKFDSTIYIMVDTLEYLEDEVRVREALSALDSIKERPVTVSVGESGLFAADLTIVRKRPDDADAERSYLILDEGKLVKGSGEKSLPEVADEGASIAFLSQNDVFGSVTEKPSLNLIRL